MERPAAARFGAARMHTRLLCGCAYLVAAASGLVAGTRLSSWRQRAAVTAQLLPAVDRHDSAAVTRLLDAGADPNAAEEVWLVGQPSAEDRFNIIIGRMFGNGYYRNRSALLVAAYSSDLTLARTLLRHGAWVDMAGEMGMTPLGAAIENGDLPMVRLLLSWGGSVNTRSDGERTPLFHVLNLRGSERAMLRIVRKLVAAGADINARDVGGRTVLDFYKGRKRWDLVAIFRGLGAK